MQSIESPKYKTTKSWNPFVGCHFDCAYCKPSFKDLLAWVGRMKKCCNCSKYAPHVHPERLTRVPSEKSIFVCEDGDISFAPPSFIKQVLEVMRNDTKIGRIWFMQSKNPACFNQYLQLLPENTYLVSTLETNRDEGYENMSKAPLPSIRYRDFLSLDWEKKIVTVEPILAFDLGPFVEQIMNINPKAVFVGYNSAPKEVRLPEPSMEQTWELINQLRASGLRVYEKDLRNRLIRKHAYRDFVP